MIYILPLILILIFAIYNEYINNKSVKSKKPIFYCFLLYLIGTMAMRYRVGMDTMNYMNYYDSIEPLGSVPFKFYFEQFEPLSYLLRGTARYFSDEFVVYQFLHVVLLNTLIARFILKNTQYILFALFFYFLTSALYFNTEILRESLAVAVFINSYKYIEEKKWLKYYICVLISIGFHTSATFLLIVPLFYKLKFNKVFWVVLVLFVVLLILFQEKLNLIALYFGDTASGKISGYLSSDTTNLNGKIAAFLRFSLFPILFSYLYKIRQQQFKYANLIVLYVFVGIGSVINYVIFSRIGNYFMFFYIILLAEILPTLKLAKYKYVAICTMIMYCSIVSYAQYIANNIYIRWYPYHSVITKDTDAAREQFWNNARY